MKIIVETIVKAPIEEAWRAYTTAEDITQWNAASDDWHTTKATVDLRVGGAFSSRMKAKDGSTHQFAEKDQRFVRPEVEARHDHEYCKHQPANQYRGDAIKSVSRF